MGIYKPTYTDRKGKTKESPHYHALFTDHTRTRRRMIGFTDKAASESLFRKLESLVGYRLNNDALTPDIAKWIDGLDDDRRNQLIECGLVDARASQAARPLSEHLTDWHDSLIDTGKTISHAYLVKARVQHLFTGCGFVRYADINESSVGKYLADKRADRPGADGKPSKGASIRTSNFYLKAAQQFCRWMVRNKRAMELPLSGAETMDAELDRRLVRRALTVDELGRLLKAAERGGDWLRTSGAERALIYRLATESGLRRNEIRSLTAGSFQLDTDEPTVTVQATNSKRRKLDVLPLSSDTAAAMRLHLASKLPAARAFILSKLTAKMLREDLTAAGIPIKTDEGEIDFHALRDTFITNLARGGLMPAAAQRLARHSTMELTMNVYTRLSKGELRAGLDVLPRFAASA